MNFYYPWSNLYISLLPWKPNSKISYVSYPHLSKPTLSYLDNLFIFLVSKYVTPKFSESLYYIFPPQSLNLYQPFLIQKFLGHIIIDIKNINCKKLWIYSISFLADPFLITTSIPTLLSFWLLSDRLNYRSGSLPYPFLLILP